MYIHTSILGDQSGHGAWFDQRQNGDCSFCLWSSKVDENRKDFLSYGIYRWIWLYLHCPHFCPGAQKVPNKWTKIRNVSFKQQNPSYLHSPTQKGFNNFREKWKFPFNVVFLTGFAPLSFPWWLCCSFTDKLSNGFLILGIQYLKEATCGDELGPTQYSHECSQLIRAVLVFVPSVSVVISLLATCCFSSQMTQKIHSTLVKYPSMVDPNRDMAEEATWHEWSEWVIWDTFLNRKEWLDSFMIPGFKTN